MLGQDSKVGLGEKAELEAGSALPRGEEPGEFPAGVRSIKISIFK